MKKQATLLVWLLLTTSAVSAMPAVSCHCFRDREFDPANPSSADTYILATTQNTYFAVVFGIDKRAVVQARMSGTSSHDLWISYYFAAIGGISPERLLKERNESGSWDKVFRDRGIKVDTLGYPFRMDRAVFSEPDLADAVVDRILVDRLGVSFKSIGEIRRCGAGSKEAIVTTVISIKSDEEPEEIYAAFLNGTRSWGAMLDDVGLSPESIGKEVERLLSERGSARP